ncbi:hypothetical protein FACS1894141_5550 [Spirochaetia bacterium]|nr:hypothetical protein FACS1894141_5550 [Spirochaetia bacterium]
MKWFLTVISLFVLVCGGCSSLPPVENETSSVETVLPEKIGLYYFYEGLCESCNEDSEKEFYTIIRENIPIEERDMNPYVTYIYNAYTRRGREEYEWITNEMGIERDNLELPIMIAGGRVFQGSQSIKNNIREAFLTAGEDLFVNKRVYTPAARKTGEHLFDDYSINPDHVTMVYFYRITCQECARVTPIVNELPAAVTVKGKQVPLDIISINTRSGNNGERVTAFFDAYNVPDEDRMVPIIFFSDSYLAGIDKISSGLQTKLEQGPGTWKGVIPVVK